MDNQEISKFIIKNIGGLRAEIPSDFTQSDINAEQNGDTDCCDIDCNCSCLFDSNDHPNILPINPS